MKHIFALVLYILCGLSATSSVFDWRVARAADVSGDSAAISMPGYADSDWVTAPVPGTVAVAYREAGLLPDMRYDDNLMSVDYDFFDADFWYRTEFRCPEMNPGGYLILNLDGINWKADVYVNGKTVGHVDGAFIRSHFDITPFVDRKKMNALAIRIIHNDNPGDVKIPELEKPVLNGGVLGLDNPTFHASIGWDWIPTVPGRNIGVWNDVTLTVAPAGVTVGDSFFDTRLQGCMPRRCQADVAEIYPTVTFRNYTDGPVSGSVRVKYGRHESCEDVTIPAGVSDISLRKIIIDNPQLWWPVGYGEPYLYDVSVEFVKDGKTASVQTLKSGIRQMHYTMEESALQIFINGRRFIPHGGNWGFSEMNLQFSPEDYDIAIEYHKDMGLNTVRNWVGQVGDEEFYEACDRHGVMIFQDFWLANPSDGPNPADRAMFVANADDMVHKTRNHPSMMLYCGRNEGEPPYALGQELNRLVTDLAPGSIYIPNSADFGVSGHGPYRGLSPKAIYGLANGNKKFHTERGMPCVPSYESMCRMLRPEHRWPQNDVWAMHNFTLDGAQACRTYNELIASGLGAPNNLKEFADRAQYVNYNGYRAMFESRGKYRNGLLLWMSHPAWPCLVFQTYDYYKDVNGAYFGCKKACRPLRVSWNPLTDAVEVVNESAGDLVGLAVDATVVDSGGSVIFHKTSEIDSGEDSTVEAFKLELGSDLPPVYFVKLSLNRGDELLADNFYWEGAEYGNWQAIQEMPDPKLSVSVKKISETEYQATVINKGKSPVPMVRLCLINAKTDEQILPAIYSDNYFGLLGGESKIVTVSARQSAMAKVDKATITAEPLR